MKYLLILGIFGLGIGIGRYKNNTLESCTVPIGGLFGLTYADSKNNIGLIELCKRVDNDLAKALEILINNTGRIK